MKETLQANIGSQAFTIDRDAYDTLHSYLDNIRTRLPEEDTETIGDIEFRIGEIFHSKLGMSAMRVVTLEMVQEVMAQMGTPADFGNCRNGKSADPAAPECNAPAFRRKLYRSRTDRSIGGVCAGIAQYLHADPTMIRLVTLLLVIFGGLSFWIYIILWVIIPEEPLCISDKITNTDKI